MARTFDGTSSRIDIANESTFDYEQTQAFSVAGWLKLSANALPGAIIAKQTSAGDGWALYNETFSGPVLTFNLRSGAANEITRYSADAAMTVGTWAHVCGTYAGTSLLAGTIVYVNGKIPTGTQSNANADTLSATILNNIPVQVGSRGGTSTPALWIAGDLSHPAIWGIALTAAQVSNLAAGVDPLTVSPNNLKLYLPMNQGNSPEPDYSTNNCDGTINSAPFAADPGGLSNPDHFKTPGLRPHPFSPGIAR